jgi:hypothetical protein
MPSCWDRGHRFPMTAEPEPQVLQVELDLMVAIEPIPGHLSTNQLVWHMHASVDCHDDGSEEVVDLGSANGTYVNGKLIHLPRGAV